MVADPLAHAGMLREVRRFAPSSQASTLLRRSLAILGVENADQRHRNEILHLCRALASEGRLVQEMAEEIARELPRH